MPDKDQAQQVGEISASFPYDNYSASIAPLGAGGQGPCDQMMDVNERRIALGGAYATIFMLFEAEAASPATFVGLNTTLRKIGTSGINDAAGATIQQDIGIASALDESLTSLSKDGFFLADFDFLFHKMGVQLAGPVFIDYHIGGAALSSNDYVHSAPWGAGAPGAGIPPWANDVQELLFRAVLSTFAVTFSVDSETKCDWLGLPMDMLPAGFGMNSGEGPSNGVPVVGDMTSYRVNFRARGGSSNGRDTSKRFITSFTRSAATGTALATSGPHLMLASGQTMNNATPSLALVLPLRIYYEGCPVYPLKMAPPTAGGTVIQMTAAQLAAMSPQFIQGLASAGIKVNVVG